MRVLCLEIFVMLMASTASAYEKPVTLAFAIDTSGSMGDDIRQVRSGVDTILRTHSSLEQQLFVNFVISPFNDPSVGPVTTTTSPYRVRSVINALRITGGGDCPEYAMAGIRNAVKASNPGSIIFFFSDASAKDWRLWRVVKNEAVRKRIVVVFVMTGCCGIGTSCRRNSDFSVYGKIANATRGALYYTPKSRVHVVMNFINAAVKNGLPALRSLPPDLRTLEETVTKLKKSPCARKPCRGRYVSCVNVGFSRRCECRAGWVYREGYGCFFKPTTMAPIMPDTTEAPTESPKMCVDPSGAEHAVGSTFISNCIVYACRRGAVAAEIRRMCRGPDSKCREAGVTWKCKLDCAWKTCTCRKDAYGMYILFK